VLDGLYIDMIFLTVTTYLTHGDGADHVS